ncbi:MAG: SDR family oxidoreductase [Anaerolineae bacterium]
MKEYGRFLWRCLRVSFVGDWRYHVWMLGLTVVALFGLNAYCTSKAALNRFTSVLAQEVAQTNIVVCGVSPGPTDTPMQAEVRRAGRAAFPGVESFRELHRRGQLVPPRHVARLIVWLASKFGAAQNGTILNLADESVRAQVAADLQLSFASPDTPATNNSGGITTDDT